MKKILVVLTGGTIGSMVEEGIINVKEGSPYRLIRMYEKQYERQGLFEVIQPMNILSENMTPNALLALGKALDQIAWEEYRGVIVTHGSDTLSYTAAFLGMLFGHVPVPVALVASNYPLGEKGSNGLANFAGAVELIETSGLRGVFVIYGNSKGETEVFLAARVLEADPFADQFRDFSGKPLGVMKEGCFQAYPGKGQPALSELQKKRERGFFVPEAFEKEVLVIRPYPGLSYERFDLTRRPAAVLHYLYHSATACAVGGAENFLSFALKCREAQIPVFTASYKRLEGNLYATGDALLRAGVIPLLNCSLEAAYAKILLAYHQKEGADLEKIKGNVYFECPDIKFV